MDMSSTEERFRIPKASLAFSKSGTITYGLHDRSTLRVSKHEFERQKALENDRIQERRQQRPTGLRHEPYYAYVARVKDQASAAERAQELSINRCRDHLQRTYQTSDDNVLKDFRWDGHPRPSTAPCTPNGTQTPTSTCEQAFCSSALGASLERAVTPGAASLDMRTAGWSPEAARSPRYMSRLHWEEERSRKEHTADRAQSSRISAAMQSTQDVKRSMSVAEDLVRNYPHGAPKLLLRKLRAQGVDEVPSLGFGSESYMPAKAAITLRS